MTRALSLLLPLAVLTLAAPAVAQTAPSSTSAADDITRELNGGPPTSTLPARPPVTEPVTVQPASQPAARPATVAAQPTTQPPRVEPRTPPVATPAQPPARPANPPAPVSTAPAATPAPAVTATEPAAPPAPPPPTVLDAAAIAALPFTLTLPAGFEIVTGRPGPDFRVYTVRRGTEPFVMIYAGPSALFPIYEGDTVEAAGRASILVMEGGRRRALEHLFSRDGAPHQVHIWVASVEDRDRDLAESIAQSVDVP